MSTPTTTGYPGTPVMMLVVGFTGLMAIKTAITAYKIRRGIIEYPKDPHGSSHLGIVGTFLFLFLMAVASIVVHNWGPA